MEILRATIHQLNKKAGVTQDKVPLPIINTPLLTRNVLLEEFVDKLRNSFAKGAPTYGCFEPESPSYPVEGFFQEYWISQSDSGFTTTTSCATSHLHTIVKENFNAIADYIFYAHYIENSQHFLFSVILNNMRGFKLNAQNQLEESPQLNEDNLHHGVRLNITRWQDSKQAPTIEQQKYLSFISKKESRVQGSQYFRFFIGATDFSDSAANTMLLKTIIEEVVIANCTSKDGQHENVQEKLTNAHSILKQHIKEKGNTPISIQEIANYVFPECPEKMVALATQRELSGDIVINNAKLNYFKKIKISSSKLSISFDRTLLNDIVYWDKVNRKLEIDLTRFNAKELDDIDDSVDETATNNK